MSTKSNSNRSRKTKIELLDEIASLSKSLSDKDAALRVCNQSAKDAQEHIDEISQLLEEIRLERDQYTVAQTDNKRLQKTIDELQYVLSIKDEELNSLQERLGASPKDGRKDQKVKNELKSLKQELRSTKNALKNKEKQLQSRKKEHTQLVQKNQALQEELDQLLSELEHLTDTPSSSVPEKELVEAPPDAHVPVAKSTFRIDLYPGQKYYQGKIVHVLSESKATFTEDNAENLISFLHTHRPYLEEEIESDSTGEIASSEQKEDRVTRELKQVEVEQVEATQIPIASDKEDNETPGKKSLNYQPTEAPSSVYAHITSTHSVYLDLISRQDNSQISSPSNKEPFGAKLTFDTSNLFKESKDTLDCNVTIYIKEIGKKRTTFSGKKYNSFIPGKIHTTMVEGLSLQSGTYKLLAAVFLNESKNNEYPTRTLYGSRIIHVV